ncbi:ATP-binding protein [Pseudonocardia hierapolitana]|uniref:ATP-binding protein n=1 Tax=Pseudonocardia hierapolitana TaxID=1128676 RepID=UPI0011BEE4E7|nr:ATP-binding protein [Pseudonocardia hierapolitana]
MKLPHVRDRVSRWLWLPPARTSPREARGFMRAVCEDWGIDETIISDALVVVTQLVTCAVVRAQAPCVVRVARAGAGLRIDVNDDCPCPMPIPGRGPVDLAGPCAVGIRLVDGLTAAWGVTDRGPGKSVWAVVKADPAAST